MSSNQIYDCPKLLEESPLLDLVQAMKSFPIKCSRATIVRWIRRGTRGTRLETIQIGNRRFTTAGAIERFLVGQQLTEPEKVESVYECGGSNPTFNKESYNHENQ